MRKNKFLNFYKILFIAVLSLSTLIAVQVRANNEEGFKLPKLPYAFDALEPYIDTETMKIHYGKHHKTYVDNLNAAINKYPDLKGKSLEELLGNLDNLPEDIRKAVRNNGGGHYNHSFFWSIMEKGKVTEPKGQLKTDIEKTFGSLDNFKAEFKKAALGQFGSGWAWLIKDNSSTLKIISTPNQDSPIMEGIKPILGLDAWEHAYYLKYQNNRGNYVDAWWNVVNWDEVEKNYK